MTGPKESWHPFVQETHRNLPSTRRTLTTRELSCTTQTSDYYANHEKGWLNRDIHGNPVKYDRGLGLCVNSPWRQKYIEQLLELIEFGADEFYYDEFPQPYQGCWCDFCSVKFMQQTGHNLPKTMNTSDPVYKLLLEFTTSSVLQHFEEITMMVNSQRPDIVNLISIYKVPAVDNNGRIYMSRRSFSTLPTVQLPRLSLRFQSVPTIFSTMEWPCLNTDSPWMSICLWVGPSVEMLLLAVHHTLGHHT